jgi:hypothetical protein
MAQSAYAFADQASGGACVDTTAVVQQSLESDGLFLLQYAFSELGADGTLLLCYGALLGRLLFKPRSSNTEAQ